MTEQIINAVTPAEPSKISGNVKSAVGAVQETLGSITGITSVETDGQTLKNKGDAEYKVAQAQGFAEGVSDRVGGKIDNVLGAVTGDSKQELSGKAQAEKGHAQQKLNEPSA